MRGDVVVVFARVPRLGTVKRRLAAEIGALAALRFHRMMLARTLSRLGRDRRFRTIAAMTPSRARMRHAGPPLAREDQVAGDLGRRMAASFRHRPHRRMVLVGCDIPDLRAADIAAAFRALGSAQAVFGPAMDGGYWLVAMGPRRPAHPFAAVRWSSRHALADTLENFRNVRVAKVRTLRDVDTAADLEAVSFRAAGC